MSVGANSEISLKVSESDISSLTATIRSPSGYEEPCVLKRLANGHLGQSAQPLPPPYRAYLYMHVEPKLNVMYMDM